MTRLLPTLAILALLVPLAGCAQKPDTTQHVDTTPTQTEGQVQYVAATLAPSAQQQTALAKDTVMLLKASSGPAGNLTSFLYTIPADAITDEAFPGQPDFRIKHLDLAFVPLGNLTDLQEYGVLGFTVKQNQSDLRFSYIDTHLKGTTRTAVLAQAIEHEVQLGSFYVSISAHDLEAGDKLAFVLAARSGSQHNLNYLVQATNRSYFDFSGRPSSAPEDLVQGKTAVALPAFARGTGFQEAYYSNYNGLGFGNELQTDAAKVTDAFPRTDPFLTVRDVTIGASHQGSGFMLAHASYLGTNAHGLWSAEVDSHGTKASGGTVVAMDILVTPLFLPELILFGIPNYFFQSDGDGDSASSMHLQVTDVNSLVDSVNFVQFDLGAPLKHLTGAPGAVGGGIFTGLAGNVPPSMAFVGRDRMWTVDQDGRMFSGPIPPH
ncbi:MAG TPA: hypothetical protein VM286_08530 [Candidatus Thermoplasmatota archaeon]|nr:hypothetical protein [Candidatus Thermoplasmatota archaeon]